MSWIGKMVGGTIGFALGGPIGAVAGAVFGHAFDVSEDRRLGDESRPRTLLSSEEQAQMTFFIACFSMLGKLAMADGRVSDHEKQTVERFMDRELSLPRLNKQIAARIFNEAAHTDNTFEEFARQFYQRFHTQPELLDLMLDILMRVSLADGVLSDEEEVLLRLAARTFNYSEGAYKKLKSRYVQDTEKYYAVLNVSSSDSDQHIKKQYRRLVNQYHPDKISAKGLPEEFITFANEKFREIQEAYEQIKSERNIP
ncbi:MAG: TerB family tellurite resistance protein [Desulfosudaceae bacterium]